MTIPIDEGWREWLAEFEREHGRPLRVLHLGNIANNAYINAKIQRRLGIEADVSCHDYYHVMGCPEWEDAPFTGDVGDHFRPDWAAVDLGGYTRPRWFAQGHRATCQAYLLAVRREQRVRAALLWRKLAFERWLICRDSATAEAVRALLGEAKAGAKVAIRHGKALRSTTGAASAAAGTANRSGATVRSFVRPGAALRAGASAARSAMLHLGGLVRRAIWLVGRVRALVPRGIARVRRACLFATWRCRQSVAIAVSLARTAGRKAAQATRAAGLVATGTSWRTAVLTVFPRRLGRLARTPEQRELVRRAEAYARAIAEAAVALPAPAVVQAPRAEAGAAAALSFAAPAVAVADPAPAPDRDGTPAPSPAAAAAPAAAPAPVPAGARLPYRQARVVEAFARAFPDRPPLTGADLAGWASTIDAWSEVLERYDIVQGYSSDPIVPLLAGTKAFTAYEHGTLRDLPFIDDVTGRVISVGYVSAPAVFVTNLDVPPRARLLGVPDERVVYLPHAVDDASLAEVARDPGVQRPPAAGPLLAMAPARHDWGVDDPVGIKGSDVMIRGIAEARARGVDVRVTFVEWGRDLDASRALCSELGLDDCVEWVGLLEKRELRRRFLGAHCVLDQFGVPAFGSVTFEALSYGCRVVTALDTEAAETFFGEVPPLFSARTAAEIADALVAIAADLGDAAGRGASAAGWFDRFHSSERIVQLQVGAYRRVLDEVAAHVPPAPAEALAHFRCPACSGVLTWTAEEGCCQSCARAWPVVRGVPRFVELPEHAGVAQTQGAFDFEHRLYERSAWTRFDPSLIDAFLIECGLPRSFFPGKRTLDAGCGSGRWSYALAELGADVTGIDLTEGGIEAAHGELGRRTNARFAQADLTAAPFEPASFDLVVSWGVLHHTPSTKASFDRLVPLVAPGGTMFVMVYEDMGDHVQRGTNMLRRVMRMLPAKQRWMACRLLVLRSRLLFKLISPWLMVAYWNPDTSPADFDSYRFGVYDAYSPRYNYVHTGDEVIGWFREAGFVEVERVVSTAGAVRVRGRRP